MGWEWFASAALLGGVMAATPGPNNAMVAASGANHGVRASMPHVLGITAGFPAMMLMIGLFGLPVVRQPAAHAAIKWIGVLYLLLLAGKIGTAEPTIAPDAATGPGSRPIGFWQAALFQWVNPKAWMASAGTLASFVRPGSLAESAASTAALAALFGALTFPAVLFWTVLGAGASRLLRTRRAFRIFNATMAGLLVLSLVPVVLRD